MRIIVDGDSCSILNRIIKIGKTYNLEIHLFHDTCHEFEESKNYTAHMVDKGNDSADFAILNFCKKGDILVTKDRGLAAMALSMKIFALATSGLEYTDYNILDMLTARHLSKQQRLSAGKNKKIKFPKRQNFEKIKPNHGSFEDTITKIILKNKDGEE